MSSISLFSNSTATHELVAKPLAAQHGLNSSGVQDEHDAVELSEQARAKALYEQGQSVAAIAAQLSTTLDAVNDYLGLTAQKELEEAAQASQPANPSTPKVASPIPAQHALRVSA